MLYILVVCICRHVKYEWYFANKHNCLVINVTDVGMEIYFVFTDSGTSFVMGLNMSAKNAWKN